jgi:uncharacterized protein YoxC
LGRAFTKGFLEQWVVPPNYLVSLAKEFALLFKLRRLLILIPLALLVGCVNTGGIEQTIQTEMDELQEPLDELEKHMQTIADNSDLMTEYLKSVTSLESALQTLAERLEVALQESAGTYGEELGQIGQNIEKLTAQIAAARLLAEKAIDVQSGSRR